MGSSGLTCLGKLVGVAVPDTILEERDSLRDRTVKLGMIARACSIYGADVVQVFPGGGRGEGDLIRKILEYLETPQYLRKRLYRLDEDLSFAGLLPPLRGPSHKPKVPIEKLKPGEVREGVVNQDGTVDIGLDMAPILVGKSVPGRRVTIRVASTDPLRAELIERKDVGDYWGYVVESASISSVFEDMRFPLTVATSRFGAPLNSTIVELGKDVRASAGVKLMFGSPSRGLFDIVGPSLSSKARFVLNLFPEQHVETVRTEEAIFAGLGLLSTLIL